MINLDGAAQLADAAHVQAGGPAQPLLAALDAAGRDVGVSLVAGAMPSDNRRYAAAGLPAGQVRPIRDEIGRRVRTLLTELTQEPTR